MITTWRFSRHRTSKEIVHCAQFLATKRHLVNIDPGRRGPILLEHCQISHHIYSVGGVAVTVSTNIVQERLLHSYPAMLMPQR